MAEQTRSVKVIEDRSAEDYRGALDTVLTVAEGVLAAVPLPQTKGAAVAVKAVRSAVSFAHNYDDVIVGIAPLVAPAAEKVAGLAKDVVAKAPEGVGRGADKVFGVAKNAAGALGGAASRSKEAVGSKVHSVADKRAQQKARKEARRALLDGAGTRLSISRFLENWDVQGAVSGGDYLDFTGCYVVAMYGHAVKKDDYSEYRDVYVGKSCNMGRAIHNDISGKGNPDVYADVKYGQDVYVLLFPCEKDKLDQLEKSLIIALDADASYNKS